MGGGPDGAGGTGTEGGSSPSLLLTNHCFKQQGSIKPLCCRQTSDRRALETERPPFTGLQRHTLGLYPLGPGSLPGYTPGSLPHWTTTHRPLSRIGDPLRTPQQTWGIPSNQPRDLVNTSGRVQLTLRMYFMSRGGKGFWSPALSRQRPAQRLVMSSGGAPLDRTVSIG